MKSHIYYVTGMHCAACGVLIEKKLLELDGVKMVEISLSKGEVRIDFEHEKLSVAALNEVFGKYGYTFSDTRNETVKSSGTKEIVVAIGIALLVIIGFIGLNRLGLSEMVNINASSSLPMLFAFGVVASFSCCAALVGGIVLSLSKQWGELYPATNSTWNRLQPHIMFNGGRLVSYGALGATLGAIGGKLNLSFDFAPLLVIVVSVLMIFLAVQMFGFKIFSRFPIAMPKFIMRFVADETNFKSRHMPFIIGALTFFLPCGFTITAQRLALISGNAMQGGLIMFVFALGTLPVLLLIGLSSVKFSQKPQSSAKFMKVAAILVLFFAFHNIDAQISVLGGSSIGDLRYTAAQNTAADNISELPPIVNEKQILKMDASGRGYYPNYLNQ